MYSELFQMLHDVFHHKRLDEEADMRVQVSSIKLELKRFPNTEYEYVVVCRTISLSSISLFGKV